MCRDVSASTQTNTFKEYQHMDIYAPIQNKYYRWYLSICKSKQLLNRHKKNNDGLNKHHIIPDSFYIESKRKSKNGWLEGNPDAPSNLVLLTDREHFIVHWILCKCYNKGLAYYKVCNAFNYMCKGDKNSKYYTIAMKMWRDINRGESNPSWTGGKITLICEMCEKEYKVKLSVKTKGSKFCSKFCGDNHQKRHRQIRICKECHNEFGLNINPSSTQKFCSRNCVDENQKRYRTTAKCVECGKYFGENLSPSRLKNRSCCSKSCANKHKNI